VHVWWLWRWCHSCGCDAVVWVRFYGKTAHVTHVHQLPFRTHRCVGFAGPAAKSMSHCHPDGLIGESKTNCADGWCILLLQVLCACACCICLYFDDVTEYHNTELCWINFCHILINLFCRWQERLRSIVNGWLVLLVCDKADVTKLSRIALIWCDWFDFSHTS